MQRGLAVCGAVLAMGVLGCGGSDPGPGHDAGHVVPGEDTGTVVGMDAYVPPRDAGSCTTSAECPGTYCNTGTHACCSPASPPIEICGDHIDQNCDMRDQSCGDHDGDTFMACAPSDTDLTQCDCDDSDNHTYPSVRGLPGGNEACDTRDNDCDGRIDEAAACCAACQALGDTRRGNVCAADGSCQCSTNAGGAACAAGQACCTNGCVDTTTDIANCGSCGFACTTQSDRCVDSVCYCGPPPGVSCTFTTTCHAGSCS